MENVRGEEGEGREIGHGDDSVYMIELLAIDSSHGPLTYMSCSKLSRGFMSSDSF